MTAKDRARVVAIAHEWIRTPYRDRARLKGVGVDCGQFLIAVYHAAGLIPDINPRPYITHPLRASHHLLETVLEYTDEIAEAEVDSGDMALYRVARQWTHGAIIVRWPEEIIHAVGHLGVIQSHGTREGFCYHRRHRFFRLRSLNGLSLS
jgi:cell wall-associated NlpC family hydrolase